MSRVGHESASLIPQRLTRANTVLRQQGMMTVSLLIAAIVLAGCTAAQRNVEEVRGDSSGAFLQDPDGFQFRVPAGWMVRKLGRGQ